MDTLHLTLKKKWFDMIASGEKKEEYREIKPYWGNRFFKKTGGMHKFDTVEFRNGYSSNAPSIRLKCLGICTGTGRTEWGANPNETYFIIKLGAPIDTRRKIS